jgi:hypothetical protein
VEAVVCDEDAANGALAGADTEGDLGDGRRLMLGEVCLDLGGEVTVRVLPSEEDGGDPICDRFELRVRELGAEGPALKELGQAVGHAAVSVVCLRP